ncbi:MAG: DUF2333 family protein [Cardiobacteriaceae bacterium]|nr:DUF2333 family protein [Cardiobacteriaceae bacterium]
MSLTSKSVGGARKIVGFYSPSAWKAHGWLWRGALVVGTLVALVLATMWWWNEEAPLFDVNEAAVAYLDEGTQPVVGSTVAGTTAKIIDTLLHKRGGYLRNDKASPAVFMDNIPEWEYGVITLLRGTTQALRNDFSRSQSQSVQAKMLESADNQMRIDSKSWMFPSTESAYEGAQADIIAYARELTDANPNNAQFFARADNLTNYLELVSKNLGDIAQQLSASVGDVIVNAESDAQAKEAPSSRVERTPWLQIDNHFYFARGYSWALLHELKAIRVDFHATLERKNALAPLDQIIGELEKTQKPVFSPVILNGRGFGFTANHSLVMASYISRVNAAIIDLQQLLRNG